MALTQHLTTCSTQPYSVFVCVCVCTRVLFNEACNELRSRDCGLTFCSRLVLNFTLLWEADIVGFHCNGDDSMGVLVWVFSSILRLFAMTEE